MGIMEHSIIIVAVAHFEKKIKLLGTVISPGKFIAWQAIIKKKCSGRWGRTCCKLGANNGALGGSEGDKFLVSENTEPLSLQPQSNNNQQKTKLTELSRETHLVQMTTQASFFIPT
jgi:hypothetical protein